MRRKHATTELVCDNPDCKRGEDGGQFSTMVHAWGAYGVDNNFSTPHGWVRMVVSGYIVEESPPNLAFSSPQQSPSPVFYVAGNQGEYCCLDCASAVLNSYELPSHEYQSPPPNFRVENGA